jgi:hypothetical protein
MFVQIIQGPVQDADLLQRQLDRWRDELKPGATGYLGSTGGVTPDGQAISVVRFESREAAEASSRRPEQSSWFNEAVKAYDGEPTFHDCDEVDTAFGGGSNDAGFVQIIQGRVKDQAAVRALATRMEGELGKSRSDILGITIAWHGDGGGFTQAVYFKSEAEARSQETATQDDELGQQWMEQMSEPPVFFDLTEPDLD